MSKVFIVTDVHLKPRRLYPLDMFQVVGHSPVKKPQLDGKLLTLDTFSTHHNGTPIGDERFVWVDTETGEFQYAV